MCKCNPCIKGLYCENCKDFPTKVSVWAGTPLYEILLDGWSRDFEPSQTLREAREAGYIVSLGEVEVVFMVLSAQYQSKTD